MNLSIYKNERYMNFTSAMNPTYIYYIIIYYIGIDEYIIFIYVVWNPGYLYNNIQYYIGIYKYNIDLNNYWFLFLR